MIASKNLTPLQKVALKAYQNDGRITEDELPEIAEVFSNWTTEGTRLAKAAQVADILNNDDLNHEHRGRSTYSKSTNCINRLRDGTLQELKEIRLLKVEARALYVEMYQNRETLQSWVRELNLIGLNDLILKRWALDSTVPNSLRLRAFDEWSVRNLEKIEILASQMISTPYAHDLYAAKLDKLMQEEIKRLNNKSLSITERTISFLMLCYVGDLLKDEKFSKVEAVQSKRNEYSQALAKSDLYQKIFDGSDKKRKTPKIQKEVIPVPEEWKRLGYKATLPSYIINGRNLFIHSMRAY